MLKKILLLMIMSLSLSIANEPVKQISSIYNIKDGKKTFIMFSMKDCPWCKKQEKNINYAIKDKYKSIDFVKIMEGTHLFDMLVDKKEFSVNFFPTSYLIIKENNEFKILSEMMGYKNNQEIEKNLNN